MTDLERYLELIIKAKTYYERIVTEIDDIVKVVRFPGWQNTNQGRNDVEKAIKSIFIKKRMFDNQLFEKAYSYVEQYY